MSVVTLKAVILDMDGLMLDTEPIARFAWQEAASRLGYNLSDEFYLTLIGRTDSECENELLEKFGPDFPLDNFRRLKNVQWDKKVESSGIEKKTGLDEFLRYLEANAIPFAIATSSDASKVEKTLRVTGLHGRFNTIVTGDDVHNSKPAPDIFIKAAHLLNTTPHHCIALEDSSLGVRAACAAGMTTIMIPDLIVPSEEIKSLAYCVVDSLREARKSVEKLFTG
jgi:HAD superfamily hydrolase (TIGR01509 family)